MPGVVVAMGCLLTAWLLVLAAAAPAAAAGTVESGDHLFLHAQVIGCGDQSRVVDHAQVSEDGEAAFAKGLRIRAAGLTPEVIARVIAERIGVETGRTPKTIRVTVVSSADPQHVSSNLRAILDLRSCGSRPQSPPVRDPPVQGYNNRLASVLESHGASSAYRAAAADILQPLARIRRFEALCACHAMA
jgi:hypothetical protein